MFSLGLVRWIHAVAYGDYKSNRQSVGNPDSVS